MSGVENGKLFGMLTHACVVADVENWSFSLTNDYFDMHAVSKF